MKAIIVDDEEAARETLAYYLQEFFPEIELLAKCENVARASSQFYAHKPDLIFLDITMPEGSGFEFTRQIDFSDALVIFVTAHAEYAIDAIKINAFDYLLKPVHISELTRVVNKARQALKNKVHPVTQNQSKIKVKYDGQTLVLAHDEIIYASSKGNYSTIFLSDGSAIQISKNLKKIEEEYFFEFPFFRTHQSYIINLNKVIQYDANDILLNGGFNVPVSKMRFDQFKDAMDRI